MGRAYSFALSPARNGNDTPIPFVANCHGPVRVPGEGGRLDEPIVADLVYRDARHATFGAFHEAKSYLDLLSARDMYYLSMVSTSVAERNGELSHTAAIIADLDAA